MDWFHCQSLFNSSMFNGSIEIFMNWFCRFIMVWILFSIKISNENFCRFNDEKNWQLFCWLSSGNLFFFHRFIGFSCRRFSTCFCQSRSNEMREKLQKITANLHRSNWFSFYLKLFEIVVKWNRQKWKSSMVKATDAFYSKLF